jgi:tRNA G18 (ribose-2'-O)-methylase SpoU
VPTLVPLDDLHDPRLADYQGVKERQLAAHFQAQGLSGDPDAPHGKFYLEGDGVLLRLFDPPPATLRHPLPHAHRLLSLLTTPARMEGLRAQLAVQFGPDGWSRLGEHTPVYLLPQEAMDRVVGFNLHRGLLGVASRAPALNHTQLLPLLRPGTGPLLVLEDLSNHDNVGALLRHAACFGCAGVLLSPGCADPLYRKAVRVSMGHALRVPWAWADPWPDALADLHRAGWATWALTPAGEHDIRDLTSIRSGQEALLIGAEGPGLTPETLKMCSHRVRITMAPGADSLNAATAGAVALYALTAGANPVR